MSLVPFLNLGRQPLANGFTDEPYPKDEYKYDLVVGFDPETYMVSLINQVDPKLMFNSRYPYSTSSSLGMIEHFCRIADDIKRNYKTGTM